MWSSILDRVVTEGGLYLRYNFHTGEIDGVPARVRLVEWSPVELAPIGIFFWTAKKIRDFPTVEQHRLERLQSNPHVETEFDDEYDPELANMAHHYNDGALNFMTPYPPSFRPGNLAGALTEGEPTYVNGKRVAREAPRSVQEVEPAISKIDDTNEPVELVPEALMSAVVRDEDHVKATE